MTDQDRPAFATLMLGLGETYGEPVSDARMEIYFAALADLELEAIRQAANAHVRASKFFPRPAELRDAVCGSVEDRAELAWMAMLRLVRRYGYMTVPPAEAWLDEATRVTAMGMYGGWRALCDRLPGEGPELLGAAKLFKASYAACHRQAQVGGYLPPGREAGKLEAQQQRSTLRAALRQRGLSTGAL